MLDTFTMTPPRTVNCGSALREVRIIDVTLRFHSSSQRASSSEANPGADHAAADIVDQHIEPAELLDAGRHHSVAGVRLGHVDGEMRDRRSIHWCTAARAEDLHPLRKEDVGKPDPWLTPVTSATLPPNSKSIGAG
jgi:hypothetical protein